MPLIVTGPDGKPLTLRCHCGQLATEVREDEFGAWSPCAEHAEEDDLLQQAEHGATVRGAA